MRFPNPRFYYGSVKHRDGKIDPGVLERFAQNGSDFPFFQMQLAPFEPALDPRGFIEQCDADDFQSFVFIAAV